MERTTSDDEGDLIKGICWPWSTAAEQNTLLRCVCPLGSSQRNPEVCV